MLFDYLWQFASIMVWIVTFRKVFILYIYSKTCSNGPCTKPKIEKEYIPILYLTLLDVHCTWNIWPLSHSTFSLNRKLAYNRNFCFSDTILFQTSFTVYPKNERSSSFSTSTFWSTPLHVSIKRCSAHLFLKWPFLQSHDRMMIASWTAAAKSWTLLCVKVHQTWVPFLIFSNTRDLQCIDTKKFYILTLNWQTFFTYNFFLLGEDIGAPGKTLFYFIWISYVIEIK